MHRLALLALLSLACAEPFNPRAGVPTLDDRGNDQFVAISAGRVHTCALTADGTAYCWGSNEFAQLGISDNGTTCLREDRNIPCRRQPVAVSGGLKFQKIRAGGAHTCALTLEHRLYCWGDNLHGQLGDPNVRQTSSPNAVVTTALFMDLAAGGSHSCGLRTDGVLLCWGDNDVGQLGTGTVDVGAAFPVATNTSLLFSSVEAGDRRTCARVADGATYCWGATWVSSIAGRDSTRAQALPQRVSQSLAFEALAVGTHTTCGVSVDNRAYCWERNVHGGIGDGTTRSGSSPREVSTALRFVAISIGRTQTCGVAETGHGYCWGGGGAGQLGVSPATLRSRCGDEVAPCSTIPLRVSGWRILAQISAGQGDHACGLTIGGNIYCWGAGGLGQRGDGRTSPIEWSPVKTRPPLAM